MSELYRHIGADVDVPAGDIGVGAREIGFLFGQYKRLSNQFTSVLTGKGMAYGGSLIRHEATGFGCVYFAEEMLKRDGFRVEDGVWRCPGSGNVAQYAAHKVMDPGRQGDLPVRLRRHPVRRKRFDQRNCRLALLEVKKRPARSYRLNWPDLWPGITKAKSPWELACDIALPCATQNELDAEAARTLLRNGCICVAEGANITGDVGDSRISPSRRVSCSPLAGRWLPVARTAVVAWKCRRYPCACLWCAGEVDMAAGYHAVDPPRLRALRWRTASRLRGANIAGLRESCRRDAGAGHRLGFGLDVAATLINWSPTGAPAWYLVATWARRARRGPGANPS